MHAVTVRMRVYISIAAPHATQNALVFCHRYFKKKSMCHHCQRSHRVDVERKSVPRSVNNKYMLLGLHVYISIVGLRLAQFYDVGFQENICAIIVEDATSRHWRRRRI